MQYTNQGCPRSGILDLCIICKMLRNIYFLQKNPLTNSVLVQFIISFFKLNSIYHKFSQTALGDKFRQGM